MEQKELKMSQMVLDVPDYVPMIVTRETEKLPYHAFTCLDKDNYQNKFTILFQDTPFRNLIVTAERTEIEKVGKKMIKLNSHLQLEFVNSGYNADDFIHDRISVLFKITQQ